MYRRVGAPLFCAGAIVVIAVTAAGSASAQEGSQTQLPPVVVEQAAVPKKKVAKAAQKKSGPQQPSSSVAEGDDVDHAAMGHGPTDIGVGTKGLALPLNTTRMNQSTIQSQLP
ncbi:MAG: hypothetical protein WC829_14090, partial [Hyphomicrobium sp.]